MKKQLLTAVLFAIPFCAAAYDYEKLPKPAETEEDPITYEEAYPDLTGKSHAEIEDITTKIDRLARQSKYRQQQAAQAQTQAQAQAQAPAQTAEQEQAPAATVSYSANEDIDRKLDEAAKHKAGKKQPQAPVREIWSRDPVTGAHDWRAAPQPSDTQTGTRSDAKAPAAGDEYPAEEFPEDEFPEEEYPRK